MRLWLIKIASRGLFAIAHGVCWAGNEIGWLGRWIADKQWDGVDLSQVEMRWPLDDAEPAKAREL